MVHFSPLAKRKSRSTDLGESSGPLISSREKTTLVTTVTTISSAVTSTLVRFFVAMSDISLWREFIVILIVQSIRGKKSKRFTRRLGERAKLRRREREVRNLKQLPDQHPESIPLSGCFHYSKCILFVCCLKYSCIKGYFSKFSSSSTRRIASAREASTIFIFFIASMARSDMPHCFLP